MKVVENILSDEEPTDPALRFFIRMYDCHTNKPEDRYRCTGCQEDFYIVRDEIIKSLTDTDIAKIRREIERREHHSLSTGD